MHVNNIRFILTDIEGTTTSISFVYETLFPYFRSNIAKLKEMKDDIAVQSAFSDVVKVAKEEGKNLTTTDEIIEQLEKWSKADKKITPLKTVQGILWKEGYTSGLLKGHVYEDVAPALEKWKLNGVELGVFSSGSVAAQKLIFGYSEVGDLTPYFSAYFDTTTGAKREVETYHKIANELKIPTEQILFLSDIKEELEAADEVGYQTIQLVRAGTEANWKQTVSSFSEIEIN